MFETEIHDGYINELEFTYLQQQFMHIPWYFNDHVIHDSDRKNNVTDYQLVHLFYSDYVVQSDYFHILRPLIDRINPAALIRVKANLVPNTHEIVEHGWHKDLDLHCKTAVFYINTNNGYTVFDDGTKIESVANRFVTFDSGRVHSGSTCTDEKIRIVLNINYL